MLWTSRRRTQRSDGHQFVDVMVDIDTADRWDREPPVCCHDSKVITSDCWRKSHHTTASELQKVESKGYASRNKCEDVGTMHAHHQNKNSAWQGGHASSARCKEQKGALYDLVIDLLGNPWKLLLAAGVFYGWRRGGGLQQASSWANGWCISYCRSTKFEKIIPGSGHKVPAGPGVYDLTGNPINAE